MNKNITKLLSVMLVAVMIVLMIPFATSAASDAEQITSLDQLTTGKYVIVATNGYAMSTISGNWVLSQKVTPANNKLTGVADSIVWTITVNGTSVKLTDSKGATLKKGSNNYVATGDFTWTVVFDNGAFRFSTVSGSDTYYLASNIKSDSKIRNYKQSTLTGSYKADYAYAFNLYKVGGTGSTPVETTPVTTTPVTTAPETAAPAAPTYVSIKDVRATATGATAYTEGVIIFIENKTNYQNVVIYDGEAGINLYVSPSNSTIKVGDKIKVHGTRGDYKGLEQLKSITIDEAVSSNNNITYKETTISAIKADQSAGNLESNAVLLKGVTIGKVNTTGNTSVKDAAGNTINIYCCPALSGIAEGDVVDIKCVVSDFNGYQLRVASAADVVKVAEETTEAAPETTVAAPETTVAAPETTVAAPETTVAAPETTVAAPETTVAAPETTAPSNPSTGDASFVIIAMAALAGVAVAYIVSKKKVRA